MSDTFYQPPSSPVITLDGMCGDGGIQLDDSIDLCNEDTFGSGAVEGDWELEHNQLVELDVPKATENYANDGTEKLGLNIPKRTTDLNHDLQPFAFDPLLSPSQLNEEELELSNRQLAAAVEELVLNSDQDQDAIDPAIVSLRKQAPHPVGPLPASSRLPLHYGQPGSGGQFINPSVSNFFETGKVHNIWNLSQEGKLESSPSHVPSMNNAVTGSSLQDDAILTAIKQTPAARSSRKRLDLSSPLVMKAEDLEREMQNSSPLRSASPVYGISIPKHANDSDDRSLPARSVSPVFGSPSPSAMPIGTPPKHVIMDMMHQLELQQKSQEQPFRLPGASGALNRPPFLPPPGTPQARLPPMINHLSMNPRLPVPPNVMWPPPAHGMPLNPLIAQDVINRLGLRMGSTPPMQSPIGSPRGFAPVVPPPRMMNNPNIRIVPSGVMRSVLRQPPPPGLVLLNGGNRLPRGPPQRFGPGHLHPEHSKFVRMRQERHNNRYDRRNYNNQRGQNRDDIIGVPGDPHANIMTQREKEWVVRIQMMALQSDRPEVDDYYYQNYIERRLRDGKLSEPGNSTRRLITPTKPNAESRKYVPVQFVNSLGKLTASSVYNPRQIIDISANAGQEDEEKSSDGESSRQALSKRLVVYKQIEKAYDIIVEIEEVEFSLSTFHGVASDEREVLDDQFKSKLNDLEEVLGFYDDTSSDVYKDPIFQIMKIRKGKKLISRVMRFLALDYCIVIVSSILSHLPILIKRDVKDGMLLDLYGGISHTLSQLNRQQFVEILQKVNTFTLTAAVKDQVSLHELYEGISNTLSHLNRQQFVEVGVTIICKLLDVGRAIHSQLDTENSDTSQWHKFVADVSDVIMAVANPKEGSRHARPSTPSPLLEGFPTSVCEILTGQQREADINDKLRSSFERLISSKSIGV